MLYRLEPNHPTSWKVTVFFDESPKAENAYYRKKEPRQQVTPSFMSLGRACVWQQQW